MPRRPPIDPQGFYHVGSRGSYGQLLYRTAYQYAMFLDLYGRSAKKYGWETLGWVLMPNHHHFVVRLTNGGLSEGMRELHGGYSRRIHAMYALTGQGHLVRHGFFGRQLHTDGEVLVACRYVDRNPRIAGGHALAQTPWSGYRATIGLEHPRPFHSPAELLALISSSAPKARDAYRALIEEDSASSGTSLRQTTGSGRMVRSLP